MMLQSGFRLMRELRSAFRCFKPFLKRVSLAAVFSLLAIASLHVGIQAVSVAFTPLSRLIGYPTTSYLEAMFSATLFLGSILCFIIFLLCVIGAVQQVSQLLRTGRLLETDYHALRVGISSGA
ncbi:MAG: hypothetical protein ACTSXC_03570 [Candidatus Freyarchaeota archaeon]